DLKAGRRLLDTRGRLGEGDKSLRPEAETGESEATHRKAIAWDIVPFGLGLKGGLAPLLDRRRTLFRNVGRGRTGSQHDEQTYREAKRDEQKETISAHEPVVCDSVSCSLLQSTPADEPPRVELRPR